MSRVITVGAAQFGPVHRSASKAETVSRLLDLMHRAADRGCDLVVFTEVALTPFFPHWYMDDPDEIDSFFEMEMPGAQTQVLFEDASRLGIGFCLGYAELAVEAGGRHRYNTSILVDPSGSVVGKYRKIHLPGYGSYQEGHSYQNLEKLYFESGNLGFQTWRTMGGVFGLCICYDRRWPETYRVLSLKGAEMILLGYNTPDNLGDQGHASHLANFHNLLSMQAGAYQNGTWVVGVAKAGVEEGVGQIGQSCVIAPSGEIVAMASTLQDELVVASCDLDRTQEYRRHSLNFDENRHIEHYGIITQRAGAQPPDG